MNANVGGIDRVLRIVIGIVLLAVAVLGGHAWAYIGIVPLLTGLLGWCPAYCPLGFSSACGGCSTGCAKDEPK